jgi:hypothetical protein
MFVQHINCLPHPFHWSKTGVEAKKQWGRQHTFPMATAGQDCAGSGNFSLRFLRKGATWVSVPQNLLQHRNEKKPGGFKSVCRSVSPLLPGSNGLCFLKQCLRGESPLAHCNDRNKSLPQVSNYDDSFINLR